MSKTAAITDYLKLFEQLGIIFEARFLERNWLRYNHRESDTWEAVCLFLENYAFERQGAKPDYKHVAIEIIQKLERESISPFGTETSELAWQNFCTCLNGKNLNHANNPLCPNGTEYERKDTGQVFTNGKSVIEFLADAKLNGFPTNMLLLARSALEQDHLRSIHARIQEINGVGTKIASLFLRDAAIFYDVYPSQNRHLLQPVDVWVQRTCDQLMPQKYTKRPTQKEMQSWIVQESITYAIKPEAVNEGMWYFSSQIAGSDYRMMKALQNIQYAEKLIEEHAEAVLQETIAWKNFTI